MNFDTLLTLFQWLETGGKYRRLTKTFRKQKGKQTHTCIDATVNKHVTKQNNWCGCGSAAFLLYNLFLINKRQRSGQRFLPENFSRYVLHIQHLIYTFCIIPSHHLGMNTSSTLQRRLMESYVFYTPFRHRLLITQVFAELLASCQQDVWPHSQLLCSWLKLFRQNSV